jgi:hypothetical protein
MRKSRLVASVAVSALIVLSSSMLAAEKWLGTWKLNLAKSSFMPGPAPKSLMMNFERTKDGIKYFSGGVDADGKPTHTEYVSKFDGDEVPYHGNPDADTSTSKKIDDNSYENVWKKDGKPTITGKLVVSEDGKTLTVTQTGTDAKGQAVNSTIVFDRQ